MRTLRSLMADLSTAIAFVGGVVAFTAFTATLATAARGVFLTLPAHLLEMSSFAAMLHFAVCKQHFDFFMPTFTKTGTN